MYSPHTATVFKRDQSGTIERVVVRGCMFQGRVSQSLNADGIDENRNNFLLIIPFSASFSGAAHTPQLFMDWIFQARNAYSSGVDLYVAKGDVDAQSYGELFNGNVNAFKVTEAVSFDYGTAGMRHIELSG